MTFAKLLPMAFVMIAGPQVLSAIFLATTENWRLNSVAYVAGASLSITMIVTIAFFVGSGASDSGASDDTLYIVVLVLLVAAAVHTFLARKTAHPPKWMGKLQTADGKLSFKLGFLLLGVFPTSRRGPSAPTSRPAATHGCACSPSCCSPCSFWRCLRFWSWRSVNGHRPSFRSCATG